MSNLIQRMKAIGHPWSATSHLSSTGLYHYTRHQDGEHSRIHLRVDPDGSGILIVNASRIMHLNPTAAFMTRLALEEVPEPKAVRAIQHRYHVNRTDAQHDYQTINMQLDSLIRPNGACPIHDLEMEVTAPFSARPSAPYRMDLALTYRCNNDCAHCYNVRQTNHSTLASHHPPSELSTSDWKKILDRLWETSIPHVVFTGGEPTLRTDLPELIAHAETLGLITGLNTNARRLSEPAYVEQLATAGLDHIQITLESHDPVIHDHMVHANGAWQQTVTGLRNALATRLFVMTNTTLLAENSPHLAGTLDFMAELGVPTIGLNALIYSGRGTKVGTGLSEDVLPPLLKLAREKTQANGQRLIWYTPTQYCHFDPMQLELGVKGCTAALYNMCIEPDGGVIPCQSYYQPLGSFLNDPWTSIWNHKLAIALRERTNVPEKCHHCELLSECGGGCPLMWQQADSIADGIDRSASSIRGGYW
jgi:radical SAM protein with 4Fe4S-binding SPASM domain